MSNIYSNWHSVTESPWPFCIRASVFANLWSILLFFINKDLYYIKISFFSTIIIIWFWFIDIDRESFEGEHSYNVRDGLKVAIFIFILSEILFFISWFWGFFHRSLSPVNEIGNIWPPIGIQSINPYSIPVLNTLLLLSSGVSVTWAHNIFLINNNFLYPIITTIILGILFTINQYIEYVERSFSIFDSIYGRSFFVTTGFHGLHVLIGSIFLLIVIYLSEEDFSRNITHNISFEFSIWYWHFVDVVWLFLITFLYLWN